MPVPRVTISPAALAIKNLLSSLHFQYYFEFLSSSVYSMYIQHVLGRMRSSSDSLDNYYKLDIFQLYLQYCIQRKNHIFIGPMIKPSYIYLKTISIVEANEQWYVHMKSPRFARYRSFQS